MKHIIILTLMLNSVAITLDAQRTFSVIVKDTLNDHQVMDALELPSGNFILVDIKFENPPDILSRILKISSGGEVMDEKDISFQGYSSALVSLNLLSSNEIVLSGIVRFPEISKLWLCTMDTSFNIIRNETFSLSCHDLYMSRVSTGYNNEIICYGTVTDTTIYHMPFAFVYRISAGLDSLQLKIFNDHWAYGLDLLPRNDRQGYYMAAFGFSGPQEPGKIISLDNSFNVRNIAGMPNIANFSNLSYIDTTYIMATGEYDYPWPSTDLRDIGVLLYDTNFRIVHSTEIGKKDTEDFPAIVKNIAFSSVHSIYIGGTSNMGIDEFSTIDSWYILNSVDSTLGVNWQKFYGGDGFYTLYGILATKDSGCLMYGTFWDYHHTENYIRYLSLIKVTKEGLLLSANDEPTWTPTEAIIYPNPGCDLICVRTRLPGAVLTLYDLSGREMLRSYLDTEKKCFNAGDFPPGIFLYQVTQNGRLKSSGKWVKKCMKE